MTQNHRFRRTQLLLGLLCVVFVRVVPAYASANDCHVCDNPNSPYCLQINDPGQYEHSFKELYRIFQSPKTDSLSAKTLQNLFKTPNDPCHRSDTAIVSGQLTNQGDSCYLKTSLNLQTGNSVKVKVTIPGRLAASINKSETEVHFSTLGWPIILEIDDPDLQADWGGDINELLMTNIHARIPRPNGCIQYNF